MRKSTFLTLVGFVGLGVSGCATITGLISPGEIKTISAAVIGVSEAEVADVSGVKQGVTTSSWTATLTNGEVYNCVGSDSNIRIDTTRCTIE